LLRGDTWPNIGAGLPVPHALHGRDLPGWLAAGIDGRAPAYGRFQLSVWRAHRIVVLVYRDGWACAYCEADLHRGPPIWVTLDHVVPRCAGGHSQPSNMALACSPCNRDKGDTVPAGHKARPRRAHLHEPHPADKPDRRHHEPRYGGWLLG